MVAETPRLRLRCFTPDDLPHLLAAADGAVHYALERADWFAARR